VKNGKGDVLILPRERWTISRTKFNTTVADPPPGSRLRLSPSPRPPSARAGIAALVPRQAPGDTGTAAAWHLPDRPRDVFALGT